MTKRRVHKESSPSEFSDWLRNQHEIDSHNGFTATNLDYIWYDYNSGRWMFIEEKRKMDDLNYSQSQTFRFLDRVAKKSPSYNGFYLIQFENTSPEDGDVFISRRFVRDIKPRKVSKDELLDFLRFEYSL